MASGACSLENSPLNLVGLREKARRPARRRTDRGRQDPGARRGADQAAGHGGRHPAQGHGVTNIFPPRPTVPPRAGAERAVRIARPRLKSTQIFVSPRARTTTSCSRCSSCRGAASPASRCWRRRACSTGSRSRSRDQARPGPLRQRRAVARAGHLFRDLYLDQDRSELFYVAERCGCRRCTAPSSTSGRPAPARSSSRT